jgi:hypothetical protein
MKTVPMESGGTDNGNGRICCPNFKTVGCFLLCMIDSVTTTDKNFDP